MNPSAIYPGTFDPVTLGHQDVIERAARIFDRLIIAVVRNPPSAKDSMFSASERSAMLKDAVHALPGVEVQLFDGLLVDYALAQGVNLLVRGLRAFSDFEYEFQMALMNRKMAPDIETLFLMPKEEFSYVSSSLVREVARLGGDISEFVSPGVANAMRTKT